MREDLLRGFSSADGSNPLADFKAAHLRAAREASTRQESAAEASGGEMVALKLELASLRSEREKTLAVDAEAARGTAKGRPYEEAVAEAVEAIAVDGRRLCRGRRRSRRRRAQGRRRRGHRRLRGRPRGRIVFEAKNARRSRRRLWPNSTRRWPSGPRTTA